VSKLDRARERASYLLAIGALILLAVVYARALRADTWPKGHPWFAVAVLATAAWLVVQPRTGAGRHLANALALLLPAVAMLAAGFMFGLW
jgi:hypothetical protein